MDSEEEELEDVPSKQERFNNALVSHIVARHHRLRQEYEHERNLRHKRKKLVVDRAANQILLLVAKKAKEQMIENMNKLNNLKATYFLALKEKIKDDPLTLAELMKLSRMGLAVPTNNPEALRPLRETPTTTSAQSSQIIKSPPYFTSYKQSTDYVKDVSSYVPMIEDEPKSDTRKYKDDRRRDVGPPAMAQKQRIMVPENMPQTQPQKTKTFHTVKMEPSHRGRNPKPYIVEDQGPVRTMDVMSKQHYTMETEPETLRIRDTNKQYHHTKEDSSIIRNVRAYRIEESDTQHMQDIKPFDMPGPRSAHMRDMARVMGHNYNPNESRPTQVIDLKQYDIKPFDLIKANMRELKPYERELKPYDLTDPRSSSSHMKPYDMPNSRTTTHTRDIKTYEMIETAHIRDIKPFDMPDRAHMREMRVYDMSDRAHMPDIKPFDMSDRGHIRELKPFDISDRAHMREIKYEVGEPPQHMKPYDMSERTMREIKAYDMSDRSQMPDIKPFDMIDMREMGERSHMREMKVYDMSDPRTTHMRDIKPFDMPDSRSSHMRDIKPFDMGNPRTSHIREMRYEMTASPHMREAIVEPPHMRDIKPFEMGDPPHLREMKAYDMSESRISYIGETRQYRMAEGESSRSTSTIVTGMKRPVSKSPQPQDRRTDQSSAFTQLYGAPTITKLPMHQKTYTAESMHMARIEVSHRQLPPLEPLQRSTTIQHHQTYQQQHHSMTRVEASQQMGRMETTHIQQLPRVETHHPQSIRSESTHRKVYSYEPSGRYYDNNPSPSAIASSSGPPPGHQYYSKLNNQEDKFFLTVRPPGKAVMNETRNTQQNISSYPLLIRPVPSHVRMPSYGSGSLPTTQNPSFMGAIHQHSSHQMANPQATQSGSQHAAAAHFAAHYDHRTYHSSESSHSQQPTILSVQQTHMQQQHHIITHMQSKSQRSSTQSRMVEDKQKSHQQ